MRTKRVLGIDADILVFNIAVVTTTHIDWGDDYWTTSGDMREAKQTLIAKMEELLNDAHCDRGVLCFSSDTNWRMGILPDYKANRKKTVKPFLFPLIREWCIEEFDCRVIDDLEADDLLGIYAPEFAVIASDDKDLDQVPGWHIKIWRGDGKLYEIGAEEARRYHLHQTLVGDLTDNYKGCPGIGKVKADRMLDKNCDWEAVLDAYLKQEITEEDALVQARVARILQPGEYDFEKQQVELWEPVSG